MKMSGEQKRDNGDTGLFSFGVHELRQAEATLHSKQRRAPKVPRLEASVVPTAKAPRHSGGNNPYDTVGGFDRSRNWSRVGKR